MGRFDYWWSCFYFVGYGSGLVIGDCLCLLLVSVSGGLYVLWYLINDYFFDWLSFMEIGLESIKKFFYYWGGGVGYGGDGLGKVGNFIIIVGGFSFGVDLNWVGMFLIFIVDFFIFRLNCFSFGVISNNY